MYHIVDSVKKNLLRLSKQFNQDGVDPLNGMGLILGYKIQDGSSIGVALTKNEENCAHQPIGVYCACALQSDSLIKNSTLTFPKKNGKILVLSVDDESQLKFWIADLKKSSLSPIEESIWSLSDYLSRVLTFRISGNLRWTFFNNSEKWNDLVQAEVEKQIKLSRKLYFKLVDGDYEMSYNKGDKRPISELYTFLKDDQAEDIAKIANSKQQKEKMIEQLNRQRMKDRPLIHFMFGEPNEKNEKKNFKLSGEQVDDLIHFEHVFMLEQTSEITELAKHLQKIFLDSINQISKHLLDVKITSKETELDTFVFRNFWPRDYQAAFITLVQPSSADDNDLQNYRKQLTNQWNLPTDRPLFRIANAINEQNLSGIANSLGGLLLNVHESLLVKPKGRFSVVQGTYAYYHYLQQGVQDAGWGCAYRSLQTLISWIQFQGYAEVRHMPNHSEIQKVLIDIGDKPNSFLGSKQWIGSTEVGYVLSTLYNISSKYIYVASGSELENKGRELAHHFDTQGSPVMIGGGQLAHTILGVDFCENTGKIRFLVLDPHYTGGEDLNTILNKGWCGWKEPSFWNKNSFYNLCLPQKLNIF